MFNDTPRSVLFAVYRFLKANGCGWIRPGKDGEIVPLREVKDMEGHVSEVAFSRFWGNNNYGLNSLEHFFEGIEWAHKVGLNTFYKEMLHPNDTTFLFNHFVGGDYPFWYSASLSYSAGT